MLAVVVAIWLSKQPFHRMAPKCVRNVPEVTTNIPWTHQSVLEPIHNNLTAKLEKSFSVKSCYIGSKTLWYVQDVI